MSGTMGAVILSSYLKNQKSKKSDHDIVNRIARDTVIHEILASIRKKFNFSRVAIIQFHNGTKYYTGESIQKASVSFETVSPGVHPTSTSMQDVPLGTMTHSLKHIADAGLFCVDDVNECEDEHYANVMRAYNEISHYAFKIEDDSGWIGVLMADRCEDKADEPALTPACCEWMKIQASRLSVLLAVSDRSYPA